LILFNLLHFKIKGILPKEEYPFLFLGLDECMHKVRDKSKNAKNALKGFSLIELLVSISILVIFAAISSPYLGRFMQNSRVSNVANDVLVLINVARIEALRRNLPVTVCALGSDNHCIAGSGTSTPFESYGMAVFEDNAVGASGNYGASDPKRTIRVSNAFKGGIYVRGTFGSASFSPLGRVLFDGLSTDGAFKVCRGVNGSSSCDTNINVRCIVLTSAGSPQVIVPTSGAAVLNASTAGGGGCI
jgi:type IV fimbrial biogenesis protein FimT